MQLPPIGSPTPAPRQDPPAPATPTAAAAARQAAEAFEAAFLAEMLKYTGLNATSESFGGGRSDRRRGILQQRAKVALSLLHGGFSAHEQPQRGPVAQGAIRIRKLARQRGSVLRLSR